MPQPLLRLPPRPHLPCTMGTLRLRSRSKEVKRLFFKKEMKDAILAGKKTTTVRDHRLDLGEYKAVSGSRFHAKPFAVLDIISVLKRYDGVDVILDNYRTEG